MISSCSGTALTSQSETYWPVAGALNFVEDTRKRLPLASKQYNDYSEPLKYPNRLEQLEPVFVAFMGSSCSIPSQNVNQDFPGESEELNT
ncbi:unnamed protein product, partial [Allacma fusca]